MGYKMGEEGGDTTGSVVKWGTAGRGVAERGVVERGVAARGCCAVAAFAPYTENRSVLAVYRQSIKPSEGCCRNNPQR